MLKLKIILASTRTGRKGPAVARWITGVAQADHRFGVELIDLAEIHLPFMDEPNHPRLRKYTHEHTKAWSTLIDGADAFIFVMPEYNYGYTAPLKNAIDFLFQEWAQKPVGLVSYGGVNGGLRATQLLKPVLTGYSSPWPASCPFPSSPSSSARTVCSSRMKCFQKRRPGCWTALPNGLKCSGRCGPREM